MLEMNIMQGAPPQLDDIPDMPDGKRALAMALVASMIDHEAALRPSAPNVQDHPFFDE